MEWDKPCFSKFGSLPIALGERCACVRAILSPEVPKLKKFLLSMLVLLGAATSAQAAVIFDFEAERRQGIKAPPTF